MFSAGDKIVYGESGVCIVDKIASLNMQGAVQDKLYYYLTPLVGSGTYFTPIDSNAFMRQVITKQEAEALVDSIPEIAPAVCNDNRFNHVDAFYKELFRRHTCEALVAVVKGIQFRMSERKTKSTRAEVTMKRARDILVSELAVALEIEQDEVSDYIRQRIGVEL